MGFGSNGRILVSVGGFDEPPVRIVAFGRSGESVAASRQLPVPGLSSGLGDCGDDHILAVSRTTVLAANAPEQYALDADLAVLPGWPYVPLSGLQQAGFPEPGEVDCVVSPVTPALGPDGTLYVPTMRPSDEEGGGLVAVGGDGKVVDGWPVTLIRPMAGFWQVEVGSKGTVYALAAEREPRGASLTLLAIDPDSTVRGRITLVEP